MESFPGIEVGAEVELNDGASAVEDPTAIRLENKQDLPLWQHLHYFDDSSSDESLDHHYEMSTPENLRNQAMTYAVIDLKSPAKVDHREEKGSAFTTAGDPQSVFLYVDEVPRDDHFVEWNNTLNKGLQDQLEPRFEETRISCVEIIPSIDFGHLPPPEVYAKTISPYEEEASLGKYSYFNAKTQLSGSVKPWGKSHTCQQCGRQFGRLYNLENHKCIKMCLGSPQQNIVNLETMNRLEKMCAEAQKELQKLQGHYKKEHVGAATGALGERDPSDTQAWSQDAVRCTRCGLQFRSRLSLDVHVCDGSSSENLTAPEETVIIDLTHSDLGNQKQVLASEVEYITSHLNGERTPSDRSLFSQVGGESTKGSNEAIVFYKCLECGKTFDKRCSVSNHLRWHARERYLVSSVAVSSPEVQEPDGTSQHVGSCPISPTNPAQTFTCEYCSRIFTGHGSYATHISWHLKNKEPVASSEVPEADDQVEQVPLILIEEQEGNKECTSQTEMYTCQSCGSAFNKIGDFVSHGCGTVEEEQQTMMEAQVFLVAEEEYSGKASNKDIVDEGSMVSDGQGLGSCLDDGSFQQYCSLVRQLSLDEQQEAGCNLLPTPLEPNHTQPPEVLESIIELIVGTEEVCDTHVVKKGHVQPKVEDSGKAKEAGKGRVEKRSPLPFMFPSALVRQLSERPNRPHRCRDCGARFHQSWRMRRHRYKVTGSTLKKHQCDCGRTPVGSLHFLLHQLQHLGDTPFVCAVCGKRLWGYRQLQAHSWVHRLVSQFQCKCGARFSQLPRYLWHSLLNSAKGWPKAQLRQQPGTQAP